MKTVITQEFLPFNEWIAKNEKFLYEQFCFTVWLEEQKDEDYQKFLKDRYELYLTIQPTVKEIQQRAFKKYAEDYPDEAREMLLELQ